MASKDPSAALPESYWQPKDIVEGQKRINGQLCHVDQMLIEILKLINGELAKLTKRDQKKIDALLKEVTDISRRVASIEPPGCDPSYPYHPPQPPPPPKSAS